MHWLTEMSILILKRIKIYRGEIIMNLASKKLICAGVCFLAASIFVAIGKAVAARKVGDPETASVTG